MIQVLTHCINTCAVAGGMRGWLGGGPHTSSRCPRALTMLVPWRVARSQNVQTFARRLDLPPRESSAPFGPCLPVAQLVGLLVSCWDLCDPFPFVCFSFFILNETSQTCS